MAVVVVAAVGPGAYGKERRCSLSVFDVSVRGGDLDPLRQQPQVDKNKREGCPRIAMVQGSHAHTALNSIYRGPPLPGARCQFRTYPTVSS